MTEKMLPKDAQLYRRIEEAVHYIWDPIGISAIPQARDEYSSYVTAIYGRVQAGNKKELIEYLKWAATENMGLSYDSERTEEAAQAMLAWKDFINESS